MQQIRPAEALRVGVEIGLQLGRCEGLGFGLHADHFEDFVDQRVAQARCAQWQVQRLAVLREQSFVDELVEHMRARCRVQWRATVGCHRLQGVAVLVFGDVFLTHRGDELRLWVQGWRIELDQAHHGQGETGQQAHDEPGSEGVRCVQARAS